MNEKMLEEMKLLWKLEDAVREQRINMPNVEKLLQKLEDLRK
jgi:hypothetical protein